MRPVNCVLKPATIDDAKPKDKRYDLTDGGGLVLEVMTLPAFPGSHRRARHAACLCRALMPLRGLSELSGVMRLGEVAAG